MGISSFCATFQKKKKTKVILNTSLSFTLNIQSVGKSVGSPVITYLELHSLTMSINTTLVWEAIISPVNSYNSLLINFCFYIFINTIYWQNNRCYIFETHVWSQHSSSIPAFLTIPSTYPTSVILFCLPGGFKKKKKAVTLAKSLSSFKSLLKLHILFKDYSDHNI